MIEETERLDAAAGTPRIRINQQSKTGANVRQVGVDVEVGQTVLAAGERLDPAEIGLLATAGIIDVPVFPRPKVAVLSTGDELIEPGEPLGPGQIRDSNRAMLLAAIHAAGGEPVDLGISGDTQEALELRVHRGLKEADILLTSGGVSMGDLDLVKPLLEHAGTVHYGRVRMKPGKPVTFATADVEHGRRLVFGLPGNPVSSLVTFYLFVVPALRKMAGWQDPNLRPGQGPPRAAPAARRLPARVPPRHPHLGRRSSLLPQPPAPASRPAAASSACALPMPCWPCPRKREHWPAGELVDALLIGDL